MQVVLVFAEKGFRAFEKIGQGADKPFVIVGGDMIDHPNLHRIVDSLQRMQQEILEILSPDFGGGVDDFLLNAQVRMIDKRLDCCKKGRIADLAEQTDDVADDKPRRIFVQLLQKNGQ